MTGRSKGIGFLALILWAVPIAVWSQSAVAGSAPVQSADLIEKGRRAVGQACAPCHSNILRIVQIHRKSADEWRDTVYSMIGRGAQILPEEIEPLIAFLAASSRRAASNAPTRQLPDAEGRSILQRQCGRCHDLESATGKPASDDWKTVIARMMSYGAELSPADERTLIDYLNGLTK